MASRRRSTWWLHLIVSVAAVSTWWQLVNSEPQLDNLEKGCSGLNAINTLEFFNGLNATFCNLRTRLSSPNNWFATAYQLKGSEPVYTLVMCRNYMSVEDCLACFNYVASYVGSCKPASGGRANCDGCFLRYENYNFYARTNENALRCSDRSGSAAFGNEKDILLSNLTQATPNSPDYFSAFKRKVKVPNEAETAIYGIAQCAKTVSQGGCQGCLTAASESMRNCRSATEGRVIDAACYMRYSNTPFFPDNQRAAIKVPPHS